MEEAAKALFTDGAGAGAGDCEWTREANMRKRTSPEIADGL